MGVDLQEHAKRSAAAKSMLEQMTADARQRIQNKNQEIGVLQTNLTSTARELELSKNDLQQVRGKN